MSQTFTIKQSWNYFEFLNAIFFQVFTSKLLKRIFLFSFIMSILSFVIDLSTATGNINWFHIIFDILLYPTFIFLFFFVVIIIGGSLLIITRKNHFKNVTYSFNHWGMEKTGNGIEFTRSWRKFLKVKESSHFIFLYITDMDAHIIQKRMLSDEKEIEAFKQLITDHLN